MRIEIPDDVKMIMGKLNSSGFKAYVVGGCVRDAILGRTPKDWDMTTNAKPDDMLKVFEHLHFTQTGIKHGTITVVLNGNGYEVTTFRKDGDYSDNRHPDSVEFVDDLVEDLARRDFTINAMAYNEEEGLIDPFAGMKDLSDKIISCVGRPEQRFHEDALRMMRSIRFSAQLDFIIDENTRKSIRWNSELIKNVSNERIRDEVCKILISERPNRILYLRLLGLMKYIIPSLDNCFGIAQNNQWHIYDVGSHIIQALLNSDSNDLETRLAVMLHDIGKPVVKTTGDNGADHFYQHAEQSARIAREWLKEYKFDNTTIDNVTKLVLYHDYFYEPTKKSVKKMLNMVGLDLTKKLIEIRKADVSAQHPKYIEERFSKIGLLERLLKEIVDSKEVFAMKDLAINGNDLIEIGFKQGKELGDLLKELMDVVLEHPEMNTRDILLGLAHDKISLLS
jgi:tRNA nucleotidyltransferase (CCA-adding enzyme)